MRVGFTAPSEARAVIETQGTKVQPEDTLLSEMEQKSKGIFFSFLMLDGTFFCSIPSSFNHYYPLLIGLKVSVSTETKTRFLKFIDTFDLGYQQWYWGMFRQGTSTHSHID